MVESNFKENIPFSLATPVLNLDELNEFFYWHKESILLNPNLKGCTLDPTFLDDEKYFYNVLATRSKSLDWIIIQPDSVVECQNEVITVLKKTVKSKQ